MSGQPKRILIVGGVAAGMSCAARLRRLDEHAAIIVVEMGPYVSYANCGLPYALGGVIADESALHVQTVAKLQSWFNLDIRVNTALVRIQRSAKSATVRDLATNVDSVLPYDKLVLAMGNESVVPSSIEGARLAHVHTLQTIPDLQAIEAIMAATTTTTTTTTPCHTAAVIGGGFIGLEAAENLHRRGLAVTIFEYGTHVFPPIDADIAQVLHDELRRNGVRLELDARVTKISARRQTTSDAKTEEEASLSSPPLVFAEGQHEPVPADLVILAVGARARTAIARDSGLAVGETGVTVNDAMQTSDPDIYAVGDMVETPNIVAAGRHMQAALAGPANRQGRLAADHICGHDVRYRGSLGTSVCKVFGLTVGIVGLSCHALDRLGIRHQYVTVHPPQHATYYGGATAMTIKLAFAQPGGRIVGAQLVGQEGVDKRIDVLATAMRAGMTVEDLEHLELGYAPPYGAAKDAVNMAGFVAGNVLRGDVQIVHASDLTANELLHKFQVLDVRSAEEYARGCVKGAVNTPLPELRERLSEVRKDVPVVVYCFVGYRGYVAARILEQNGYDVYNLDGGFKTVTDAGYRALQEHPHGA
ncbi:FAD-dependent pyridine nucleotide-disulfide oxidoreductase [Niveomyces insectorum RCEF 264]|uniref:FAD-dependent pyridine nucleotide-disulfide oxidoreductase n=1 Tax=Niveomyces insectorum RCEF 264 TaxID=1081102 RepID=A0A167S1T8_9HYPO|nr:FAD-dependent pyridine nucleotide-disulfide oxidoreductase [Niveomyces insectorum RCEF 264]